MQSFVRRPDTREKTHLFTAANKPSEFLYRFACWQAATQIREWYLHRAAQRCRMAPPSEEDLFRQASKPGLDEWGLDLVGEMRLLMYRYRFKWRIEAPKVTATKKCFANRHELNTIIDHSQGNCSL